MSDEADRLPRPEENSAEDDGVQENADKAPLPKDAAAWRELLAALPSAAVLKILQEEKGRAERIFAGFRPNAGGIPLPAVRDRLIKEALKFPKLAEALAALTPKAAKSEKENRPVKSEKMSAIVPPMAEDADTAAALRVKVEKHRAALRENEARIHFLETRLAVAEQEAQRAKSDGEMARAAERQASERAERLQRQKEREERRPPAPAAPREKTVILAAAPAVAPPPPLFEETMQRMMEVGKAALVADLCRYALRTDAAAENPALRGRVHAAFADALHRTGDIAGSVEQGRQSIQALLEGGDAVGAANAFAQWAARTETIRKEDAAQISRLLKLAAATHQENVVREIFLRLALSSPGAFKRVRAALPVSEAAKLKNDATPAAPPPFGPTEIFNMPGVPHALTPRRVVRAVEAGEEKLVSQIRAGMAAWRERDKAGNQYADALLTAIERLSPSAVFPLTKPQRGAIIVDASNVARRTPDPLIMDTTGRVAYLISMRDHLLREGWFPAVLIADANLGYRIDDPASYLSLLERHIVLEVTSGGSADEALIREARQRNAPLVTNDRLRDWKTFAADIRRFDFLILSDKILLEEMGATFRKESAN